MDFGISMPARGTARSVPEFPSSMAEGLFHTDLLTNSLLKLGLPLDGPLTGLVLEIFQEPAEATPLRYRLGPAACSASHP